MDSPEAGYPETLVTTKVVPGEGTWTINPKTAAITFTPEWSSHSCLLHGEECARDRNQRRFEDFVGTAKSVVVEIASGYTSKNGQTEAPHAVYTPTVNQDTQEKKCIPYDVEITYDDSLAAGEIKTDQEGELGEKVKVDGEWKVTKEAKPHKIRVSSKIQAAGSSYT